MLRGSCAPELPVAKLGLGVVSEPDKKRKVAVSNSMKSLAADKSVEGVKKTDLFRVDPRLLVEKKGFNLRNYKDPEVVAHIEGFKESYKAGRYVPPLLVYVSDEGEVVVVEGHCRRRGALDAIDEGAEISFVDCVPFKGNDAERVEVMLRSAEGKPLKPLEVAMGVLRLHRWGMPNTEIAERLHKTASNIEQLLVLATANRDVHDLVRSGAVSAYTAVDAVREHGEAAGSFLASQLEAAKANGKTKVTRSSIQGWCPPRRMVSSLVSGVEMVTGCFDSQTRRALAEMEGMTEQEIRGRKVEVDAAAILALMRLHGDLSEAKGKHEAKALARAQAASQTSLEM